MISIIHTLTKGGLAKSLPEVYMERASHPRPNFKVKWWPGD